MKPSTKEKFRNLGAAANETMRAIMVASQKLVEQSYRVSVSYRHSPFGSVTSVDMLYHPEWELSRYLCSVPKQAYAASVVVFDSNVLIVDSATFDEDDIRSHNNN